MRKRKKNNNLIVNIFISFSIVCLIISLILFLNKNRKIDNHIVEIDYNTYREIINKDEYSIIILTSPTCDHCKAYKPNVNYVADDYHLTIYELNVTKLNYQEYIEIHDMYHTLKNRYDSNGNPSIRTPATLITRNGEEIDSLLGDAGYNGFLKILKDYEIVK